MKAIEIIAQVLTTKAVEGAAADSHNGWRESLEAKRPIFQGFGPKRIRVRDLALKQRIELDIPNDANPGWDVFHPLFKQFDELDTDTKAKNVLPLVALCYGLADFILSPETTREELEAKLEALINGKDIEGIKLLSAINHMAFIASEVRTGVRAYGEKANTTDFPPFRLLDKGIAALDEYTLLPAAKWLLEYVRKNS